MEEMEKFLKLDLMIKDLIIKIKPPMLNYNKDAYIKYVDDLFIVLDKIKNTFDYFVDYLEMNSSIKDLVKNKFSNYKERFLTCNYDYDRLKKEYEHSISSMTPGIIDAVGSNFFGYSFDENEKGVLMQCNTINDMLHAFHHYLINNEKFYDRVPVIETKILNPEYHEKLILCGKENQTARDLFNNFPSEVETLQANILSLDNIILIMIRDLGHCLSIEITKENNNYRVKYFIPKACNIDKINALKGVDKLDPKTADIFSFTKGEFVTNEDNLTSEIVEFIKSVPSDKDIVHNLGTI